MSDGNMLVSQLKDCKVMGLFLTDATGRLVRWKILIQDTMKGLGKLLADLLFLA